MEHIPVSDLSEDRNLGRLLQNLLREVKSYAEGQIHHIKKLTEIGLALSGEKDINRLLEMIVDEARKLSHADAGTLYILDNEKKALRFEIIQNDSMNIRQGGVSGRDTEGMPDVPLYDGSGRPNHTNVSSYVALTGEQVNIADVYQASDFNFSGTRKYDVATGYRSQSMLVIPLRNHEDSIIGVLQLLNATDPETGEVIPFLADSVDLVASLASQAAIAITNAQLIENLKNLFYAFIKSIATAIDDKSPFTGGHIARVVTLTMDIAEAINQNEVGRLKDIEFSADEMEELRLAAWMHDVGKITTPEYIVSKTNKLEGVFDRIELIETRFSLIRQTLEADFLRRKIDILQSEKTETEKTWEIKKTQDVLEQEKTVLKTDLELLQTINTNKTLADEKTAPRVKEIAARTYTIDNRSYPYLSDHETACLSIIRGNLLPEERQIMEHHAEMTSKITNELPFPHRLAHVPQYASSHHEKLDGSGYPRGLSGDEIPIQARIIAIADVFEALTARDRPYKAPMNISQALKILGFMEKDGHIDPDIYALFMNEKIYQKYSEKELNPEQMK